MNEKDEESEREYGESAVRRMRAGLLSAERLKTSCCNVHHIAVYNWDRSVVLRLVDQPMYGSSLDAENKRKMCEKCQQILDIGWIVE